MFEDFTFADFPSNRRDSARFPARGDGFIYVIFWVCNGRRVPFYVGQTERLCERIEDYCIKQFAACTDFRVGEAICYFRNVKNFPIVVGYKPSSQPVKDEYTTIRSLQTSGVRLLNDLVSYQYKDANKDEERTAVQKFCDVLIR